jgi:hypothetical protein
LAVDGITGTATAIAAGGWYTLAIRTVHGSDSDGEGIPDDVDTCPHSDLAPTVVIGTCDSGMVNHLQADGYTITDRVDTCALESSHHGDFVSCIARMASDVTEVGVVRGAPRDRIQRCAAQARTR